MRKKEKEPWTLSVTRPLELETLERLDRATEKAAGKRCWASGAGLGEREMSFAFASHDEAVAAGMRVKQALVVSTQCTFEVFDSEVL